MWHHTSISLDAWAIAVQLCLDDSRKQQWPLRVADVLQHLLHHRHVQGPGCLSRLQGWQRGLAPQDDAQEEGSATRSVQRAKQHEGGVVLQQENADQLAVGAHQLLQSDAAV